MGIASFIVYVAAIVAANVATAYWGMVPVGFGLMATAGTYAAGFALLARDFTHRYAGIWWAFSGIMLGIVLSWFLASPALAVASAAAFAVAEVVDMGVYLVARRRRGFITSAAISNLVSAPLDTLVFLFIAGFPVTIASFAGQMLGKLLWATAVPLLVYGVIRALLRKPQHAIS